MAFAVTPTTFPHLGVQRWRLEVWRDLRQHGHIHLHLLALTVHLAAQPPLTSPNGCPLAIDVAVAIAGEDTGLGGHAAVLDDVHGDEDDEEHEHKCH